MPSLRGASLHLPDSGRGRARHPRRRLVRVQSFSASLLISLSATAQTAHELQPRAASGYAAAPAPSSDRVILLVRTENDQGVMNRVRAELRASGWQILELGVDERSARLPLGKLAAQQAIRAAVRFDAADARIELWIFRAAGNVEETIAGSGEREDDAVMALRISEELRARGLDFGDRNRRRWLPRRSRRRPRGNQRARRMLKRHRLRWGFALACALPYATAPMGRKLDGSRAGSGSCARPRRQRWSGGPRAQRRRLGAACGSS